MLTQTLSRGATALLWPFRDRHGQYAVGWIVAADFVVWAGWLLGLLLFLLMPPVLALLWIPAVGSAFFWRYAGRGSAPGWHRRVDPGAGFGTASSLTVAAGALLIAVFGQFWDVVYRRIPGVHPPPIDAWDTYTSSPLGLVAVTIVFVGIGPVMEEFCFRGWIMRSLVPRYGPFTAIVGSSLLFAAAHAWVSWIPYFFVAGLILACAVHLTGSVWTGVALHAGYNAMCAVLEPVFPTPESIAAWSEGLAAGSWSAPLAMVLSVAGLTALGVRVRSSSPGRGA